MLFLAARGSPLGVVAATLELIGCLCLPNPLPLSPSNADLGKRVLWGQGMLTVRLRVPRGASTRIYCWLHHNPVVDAGDVALTVLGCLLGIGGMWAKTDAHRILGDYAW